MTAGRRKLIRGVSAVIVFAHLVAMLFMIDHWPLSNYPMFSSLKNEYVSRQVVCGVAPDGSEVELRNNKYFSPLGSNKLSMCLSGASRADRKQRRMGNASQPRLPKVAGSLLEIYNTRRAAGLHNGPPMEGLRLYEVTWRIDPTLANLDRPENRKLLAEYVASKP